MAPESDLHAIRLVVTKYLGGVIHGQYDRLRESMHPQYMQAGHDRGRYEFIPRDEFIEVIKRERKVT